ncbi:Mobile element protein [Candidatus Enterovibrio altilux]|uniref:Mobile element protein n=1 Tax=Candidatus Enterovibrio altilux TaxID=1927128 RepID=A0A291B8E4_9GAMM|nr:Mobile element protein [Candidatus Enterovibrio luxaltus]
MAMFRVKKLFEKILSLRDHNGQVSETYGMLKALNQLIELSEPKIKVIM